MKGRDLIKFILDNKLEDVDIFEEGFLGFPTAEEVAIKLGVGMATVTTLIDLKVLDGINYNGKVYIFPDSLNQHEESKEVANV
jgi:hypothetical protein